MNLKVSYPEGPRSSARAAAMTAGAALAMGWLSLGLVSCASEEPVRPMPREGARRVVFLMLDGVRWQEFFGKPLPEKFQANDAGSIPVEKQVFERFWNRRAQEGVVYGKPGDKNRMWIANSVMYSLPAYRSIFAGSAQNCFSNSCGRVMEETLPERLTRELELKPGQAVSIASWVKMDLAVESREGAHLVNTGMEDFPGDDPVHAKLNAAQAADKPEWEQARKDRYTFLHALHYLKANRPRYLYISLNDADEWAHLDKYKEYIEILKTYDGWIDELITTIDTLPGETTLIITTDHGRGFGERWKNHGYEMDAVPIWLYVRGPRVHRASGGAIARAEGRELFTHLDIRPTVEALLGVEPRDCWKCGKPLRNALGQPIPDKNTIARAMRVIKNAH